MLSVLRISEYVGHGLIREEYDPVYLAYLKWSLDLILFIDLDSPDLLDFLDLDLK